MTLQEAADAYASACNEADRADRSRMNAEAAHEAAVDARNMAFRKRYAAQDQLVLLAAGVAAPLPVPAAVAAPKRPPLRSA